MSTSNSDKGVPLVQRPDNTDIGIASFPLTSAPAQAWGFEEAGKTAPAQTWSFEEAAKKEPRAGSSIGFDFDPLSVVRELVNPLLFRALVAEFLGALLLLFFALTTAVYRERWITNAGSSTSELPLTDAALLTAVSTNSAKYAATATAHLTVSFVFGFTVFCLVYTLSPISGGHFNPAVTWGLAVTRKVTVVRAICYTGAQCGGAVVGALLSKTLDPAAFADAGGGVNGRQSNGAFNSTSSMMVSEIVGTFLLVLVVYAAVDPQRAGEVVHISALGPLAIGLAVLTAHLALIPVTGCSINPARSFGAAVASNTWTDHWVFWCGPLVGGLLAAFTHEALFKGRKVFEERWA